MKTLIINVAYLTRYWYGYSMHLISIFFLGIICVINYELRTVIFILPLTGNIIDLN